MIRALPIALVLVTAAPSLAGQQRAPAFLAEDGDAAKLETLHLEARIDGDVHAGADGRGVVTLSVTPKAKMHVYAAGAEGYVPFTLKLEPPAAVAPGRITYPTAEIYVFPPTGESSRVYIKPFKVTQAFVLTPAARKTLETSGRVQGVAQVRYQACDDSVCYRPTTGTLSFEIVR